MQTTKKIIQMGNSASILIPSLLMEHLGVKIGDQVIIQDDEGKHGKFISIWKKEE